MFKWTTVSSGFFISICTMTSCACWQGPLIFPCIYGGIKQTVCSIACTNYYRQFYVLYCIWKTNTICLSILFLYAIIQVCFAALLLQSQSRQFLVQNQSLPPYNPKQPPTLPITDQSNSLLLQYNKSPYNHRHVPNEHLFSTEGSKHVEYNL